MLRQIPKRRSTLPPASGNQAAAPAKLGGLCGLLLRIVSEQPVAPLDFQ
jgi:hypothetical protein